MDTWRLLQGLGLDTNLKDCSAAKFGHIRERLLQASLDRERLLLWASRGLKHTQCGATVTLDAHISSMLLLNSLGYAYWDTGSSNVNSLRSIIVYCCMCAFVGFQRSHVHWACFKPLRPKLKSFGYPTAAAYAKSLTLSLGRAWASPILVKRVPRDLWSMIYLSYVIP